MNLFGKSNVFSCTCKNSIKEILIIKTKKWVIFEIFCLDGKIFLSHWTIIPRTSNFQDTKVLFIEKFAPDNWKPKGYALDYSGLNQPLKSFYGNFWWWDFSLIFHLTPSIYAFRCNFFYINDSTYSINNIIYRCRHSEIIKEKYECLNFQALKKLTKYYFLPVIWIVV